MANKVYLTNCGFDASAKTVTFTDYVAIELADVLQITNVTDNVTIYDFGEVGYGGTVAGNVLTLDYDTTLMDDADKLMVVYYDPNATQEVSATNLDIRDLSQTSDSVAIYGSDDGGTTKRIIKTDAGGAIQVDLEVASVTVTSSALPTGASTSANQTNGSQKSQIVDSAGDITDVVALNAGLSGTDKGLVTNTVIHGLSTAGGGTYVDVKVDPSGSIQTTANQDIHDDLNANANIQVANTDVSNANPVPISDAGGSITVDGTVGISGTVPISAASLPLPTGAATEATLSTRLSESNFDTKIGSLTETAPTTDTASSGLNGRLQRIAQRLTTLIAAVGTPFQDGGSIGNTSFGASQTGTWNINNVSGTVSLPTGAATAANQASEQTLVGAVNETAPASDTASSGLNGRLQRIAQRITSLIALFPTALTSLGNFKVSIQEATGSTPASASYTSAQTNTTFLTPTSGKRIVVTGRHCTVDIDTSVAVTVRMAFGSPVSTSACLLKHEGLAPGSIYAPPMLAPVKGAVNQSLLVTTTAATDGSVDFVVDYYEE